MFTERCNAYFHDPDVDYQRKKIPETFKEMFFVRNIFNDEALINLTKTSRMGMLV